MEKTLDVNLQTRTATAVSSNTRLICAMSPRFWIFNGSTSSSPVASFPGFAGFEPAIVRVRRGVKRTIARGSVLATKRFSGK